MLVAVAAALVLLIATMEYEEVRLHSTRPHGSGRVTFRQHNPREQFHAHVSMQAAVGDSGQLENLPKPHSDITRPTSSSELTLQTSPPPPPPLHHLAETAEGMASEVTNALSVQLAELCGTGFTNKLPSQTLICAQLRHHAECAERPLSVREAECCSGTNYRSCRNAYTDIWWDANGVPYWWNYSLPPIDRLADPSAANDPVRTFDRLFVHLARTAPGGLAAEAANHHPPVWHKKMVALDVWRDAVYERTTTGKSATPQFDPYSVDDPASFCTHEARVVGPKVVTTDAHGRKISTSMCKLVPVGGGSKDGNGTGRCKVPIVCGQLGWSNCWESPALSEELLQRLPGAVLVTLRGDGPAPNIRKASGITAWFSHATRRSVGFDPQLHFDTEVAMPIGLAGLRRRGWLPHEEHSSVGPSGDIDLADVGLGSAFFGKRRDRLLLVNFGALHHARFTAVMCAELMEFTTVLRPALFKGIYQATGIPRKSWNKAWTNLLSRFQFVLSLEGAGWDCYRTWDILYAGAIPILVRSGTTMDAIYKDLPVLMVDSVSDITRVLLERTWVEFERREFNVEKLRARYWSHHVYDAAGCLGE